MIRRRPFILALTIGALLAALVVGLYVFPGPCENDLALEVAWDGTGDIEYIGTNDSLTLVNTGEQAPGALTTEVNVIVIDNQTDQRETITWYDHRNGPTGHTIQRITITDNDTSFALDGNDEFFVSWVGYEVPAYCLGRQRVDTVLLYGALDERTINSTDIERR